MKNAMVIQAIENRLNLMAGTINELIDENPGIDLESFKETFLKELAALLDQNSEFEFSNSLFELLGAERTELKEKVASLEKELQVLTERVLKIESALDHKKVEESKKV